MRKVTFVVAAALLCALVFVSCGENAGPLTKSDVQDDSSIRAYVKDASTGNPIPNAHVEIYIWEQYGDWAFYTDGYTDSNGRCIKAVTEGEYYKVVASKDGYGSDEEETWVYQAPVSVYLYLNEL